MPDIIDSHIHLSERQDDALIPFARTNDLAYNLNELFSTMQENKIGRGSLLISDAVYFAGGAEKIVFGTDYPVTKHSDALSMIKRLDVDDADKQRILWRNATRVFRL